MANTIRIAKIDLEDDDGVGPVHGTAHVVVTSDDAVATALDGGVIKRDARLVTLPRGAWNQLVAALRRPRTDVWPDGTIAHPVTKDP